MLLLRQLLPPGVGKAEQWVGCDLIYTEIDQLARLRFDLGVRLIGQRKHQIHVEAFEPRAGGPRDGCPRLGGSVGPAQRAQMAVLERLDADAELIHAQRCDGA